jgi:hypothetical protein
VSRARQSRSLWIAIAGVPVLFVAIVALQTRIDARMCGEAQTREVLLLRSPSALKKMSLGYNGLLADIYWTRAVQYYGWSVLMRDQKFGLLWPLLDITTTLDPKLLVAYHFGAIFLSQSGTYGAGRTDLAIELVKRGIAANPDRWGLYEDLGFLYYWHLEDYPAAASAYLAGSKTPHAPDWLKIMAARMDQKIGSIETARMLWSEVYESNQNSQVRKLALNTLRGLKAKQDETDLDQLADKYRQRFGRFPSSTAELRDAGLLNGIPVDPEGYAYVLGPDGKARLNPESPVVIPNVPKPPLLPPAK